MMFAGSPSRPRLNRAFLIALRPVATLMAMGMAYDAVRQMTPTPEKALKASEEPK